jgi:predicted TIM-barrel fold metal-dependent hydrolase
MAGKPEIIAIEEHYWDKEVSAHFGGTDDMRRQASILERLYDYAEIRIKEMDEAGIDIQVLSHGAPSTQRGDAATMVKVARAANDKLAEIVKAHPKRFGAFGCLPTPDPKAAADELERIVTRLGFQGAMIHGLTNDDWPDDKKFWPIYERAEKLDVPIYLHPAQPHPSVADIYYKPYLKEFPGLLTAGWGFGVETATMAIRLVLSRVFEKHPNLKIVLGHMGEGIPFMLWRISQALSRPGNKDTAFSFRDHFSEHFWITTSGNFSNPALLCSVMELGVDRIIFSIDYPFVPNKPGVDWIPTIPLCAEDKAKILSGNARKLLKLK